MKSRQERYKYAQTVLDNVRVINSGATYNCNEGLDPYYKTDENLVELFASLDCGYDDVFIMHMRIYFLPTYVLVIGTYQM